MRLPTTTALASALDTAMDRTLVPGYTKIGLAVRRRLPGWPPDPAPDALVGREAAVTGASSGLGEATALGLARLGARVHLVVRNEDKGGATAEDVRRRVPGAQVVVWRCDLTDLEDVRRFTDAFTAAEERLDVVVHNAGVMPPERTESAQGHELSMACHLLGPVLMTDRLRPVLRGRDARVVVVTSGGMYAQELRADDPEYHSGKYTPTTAYARSKRAQVELLPDLDQRWRTDGISVHAMHPGWADTPGVTESLPAFGTVMGPLLRDPAGGADTSVWLCAVEPAPESGQLWQDRRPRPVHLLRRTRTAPEQRAEMWRWTLRSTGLKDT